MHIQAGAAHRLRMAYSKKTKRTCDGGWIKPTPSQVFCDGQTVHRLGQPKQTDALRPQGIKERQGQGVRNFRLVP